MGAMTSGENRQCGLQYVMSGLQVVTPPYLVLIKSVVCVCVLQVFKNRIKPL